MRRPVICEVLDAMERSNRIRAARRASRVTIITFGALLVLAFTTPGIPAQDSPTTSDPSEAAATDRNSGFAAWTSNEMLDRADVLIDDRRFKEAAYLCRRVLSDEPGSARATYGLARCVEGLGDTGEALRLYRNAVAINPDLTGARAALDRLEPAPKAVPKAPEPAAQRRVPTRNEPPPRAVATDASDMPTAERASESTSQPETAMTGPDAGETAPPPETEQGSESPPRELITATPAAPKATGGDADGDHVNLSIPEPEAANTSPRIALIVGLTALALAIPTVVVALVAWRRQSTCTLRGQLEHSSLPELLQWLAMSRKDGELKISSGANRGRLGLQDGQPVHAMWKGTTGMEAVFELLSLTHGSYVFRESSLTSAGEQTFDLNLQQILMQWACETDEANRNDVGDGIQPLESVDDSTLNTDLPF